MGTQTARQQLEELAVAYSEDSYFDHVKAGRGDIVALFIRAGMPVDVRNQRQETALMLAADSGHEAVVNLLLAAHSDVNSRDEDGYNPLMRAADSGHVRIVKRLLEAGANVNAGSKMNQTALWCAARTNQKEITELLIAAGAAIDNVGGSFSGSASALGIAACRGFVDLVKLFIQAGANVEDVHGKTDPALIGAAAGGHLEVVKLLLAAGADVNAKSLFTSSTALMEAAQYGHCEVVKLLLEAGAEVNVKNHQGYTPLMQAIIPVTKSSLEVVTELVIMLLEAGAEVNVESQNGWTPIKLATTMAAQSRGHSEKLAAQSDELSPEIVNLLLHSEWRGLKLSPRFGVYWDNRMIPTCVYCGVRLRWFLYDNQEYFRCPLDDKEYRLRDKDGNRMTLAEAQEQLAKEKMASE